MDRIAVETSSIALLVDDSAPDAAQARGRLLERFVARLLATMGYGDPRTEHLNVTNDGAEIDVIAQQKVTNEWIMCECKAHSSNITVRQLTAFLGEYALATIDDPRRSALFIGLPSLTRNAKEKADEAQRKMPSFRYLSSYAVCQLLVDANLLPPLDNGPALMSDPTVVVAEHGLALAARELDSQSRHAVRLVLWGAGRKPVPDPMIALAKRHLSNGLPTVALESEAAPTPHDTPATPAIVPVRGSSSDFEFQPPAGPAFFVGRKVVSKDLREFVCDTGGPSVLVINAKSGWGKSSLALYLQHQIERAGGMAMVIDTRTADRPDFVSAAIERLLRAADERGILAMPGDRAFSSLRSTIDTFDRSTWCKSARPLLVVFDQFENVFRNADLTREFRDLALQTSGLRHPLTVGYAWKTDLVGWTEDHPYQLRDEIRSVARNVVLEPFGPREIETLLRRLETALDKKLHRELRRRLRELSQGLPWLFKKLAGHVLTEMLQRGVPQDQLIQQSLNVHTLFESDLSELTPSEQEALRIVARSAPALVSDIEETVSSAILQSLLNRRLIVQVGERIDTYWDTFRDFLITGRVAIEDSYIIRNTFSGPAKLLRAVLAERGDAAVPLLAKQLKTSNAVIFNSARELRQMGILAAEPNRIVVEAAVLDASNREEALRDRVAYALRHHKIYGLLNRLFDESDGIVSFTDLASAMPSAFPAVEAKRESWITYARAFGRWLEYGALVMVTRNGLVRTTETASSDVSLLRAPNRMSFGVVGGR